MSKRSEARVHSRREGRLTFGNMSGLPPVGSFLLTDNWRNSIDHVVFLEYIQLSSIDGS
jgi:hypothetical protein